MKKPSEILQEYAIKLVFEAPGPVRYDIWRDMDLLVRMSADGLYSRGIDSHPVTLEDMEKLERFSRTLEGVGAPCLTLLHTSSVMGSQRLYSLVHERQLTYVVFAEKGFTDIEPRFRVYGDSNEIKRAARKYLLDLIDTLNKKAA